VPALKDDNVKYQAMIFDFDGIIADSFSSFFVLSGQNFNHH